MNKEQATKFIDEWFEDIEHSDIRWDETNFGEVYGTIYVTHIGNEQLLPLIALYDVIIMPICLTELEKIEELDGAQNVILIEINDKE